MSTNTGIIDQKVIHPAKISSIQKITTNVYITI